MIEVQSADASALETKRANRLSGDGKWRSFSRVPHLLQYVPTGKYYGRVKIRGKIIRKSLKTDVWTTAKLKLVDFLRAERIEPDKQNEQPNAPRFEEALQDFSASVESDSSMKQSSKDYRQHCIRKLKLSWPDLWTRRIDNIPVRECAEWAGELNKKIAGQYFNNVVSTLRLILDSGIERHMKATGVRLDNPADHIAKTRIPQKQLSLPEPDQFRRLVTEVRKASPRWGRAAADLVEFLAYSGVRLKTEARWITWNDVDWKRSEIVVRGQPDTQTKNWEIRRIPILPDMELLLKRIADGQELEPTQKVLSVLQCSESLKSACRRIGIPKLRHHDLRHLFATRCIESGVDIPTVAHWLGHKDKGALAMKVYGHLRNEHSQAMARKVKF